MVGFGFFRVHSVQLQDLPKPVPLGVDDQLVFGNVLLLAVLAGAVDQGLGYLAESSNLHFAEEVFDLLHFQQNVFDFFSLTLLAKEGLLFPKGPC